MKRIKLVSLFVLALNLASCGGGKSKGGGIVDNGKTGDTIRTLTILGEYLVTVSGDWSSDQGIAQTEIAYDGENIVFTKAAAPCEGETETLDSGLRITLCSQTQTQLQLPDDELIEADHSERSEQIDLLLRTFRRK